MTVIKSKQRKPSAISRSLGKKLRLLRNERGWTSEYFAERAGLHPTYISSLENGNRNPTLNVVGALARALSISISELTKGI